MRLPNSMNTLFLLLLSSKISVLFVSIYPFIPSETMICFSSSISYLMMLFMKAQNFTSMDLLLHPLADTGKLIFWLWDAFLHLSYNRCWNTPDFHQVNQDPEKYISRRENKTKRTPLQQKIEPLCCKLPPSISCPLAPCCKSDLE